MGRLMPFLLKYTGNRLRFCFCFFETFSFSVDSLFHGEFIGALFPENALLPPHPHAILNTEFVMTNKGRLRKDR